jgi:putative acetyltransferase
MPADWRSIEAVYPLAFPDEDLVQLVHRLLQDAAHTISLVAVTEAGITGNIVFTRCTLGRGGVRAALLAPLAIVPAHQKQGLGSALIRTGLDRLREEGAEVVYVLGDPAYYGRLGFMPERSVAPPCPVPPEWANAWQSLRLGDKAVSLTGTLKVPETWLDPALWSS